MLKKIVILLVGLPAAAMLTAVLLLEVVLIPNLLVDALAGWGRVALFAPVLHLVSILVIVGTAAGAAWRGGRAGILETHRLLVDTSLGPVVSSIERVVNGKWSADSHLQGQALNIGAKVGMVAGQARAGEVDRGQVIAAIEAMALPAAQRQLGDGLEVVTEMDSFILDQKKTRLS